MISQTATQWILRCEYFAFKRLDENIWLRCDADITICIPVLRFILLHEHLHILVVLINVQNIKQVGISYFGFIIFIVQIYMRPLSENTSSLIKDIRLVSQFSLHALEYLSFKCLIVFYLS